ncbi:uncharacterized protein I206_106795 [Kwoniella pini CBS 10737]|uniref:Major facilitator superfamily (MFS) profile domain-containing protein n=1 Tax=Kwoniella pini CBS 10737 TaxID=1296096 RepID=A0A1B9I015_9TREE|nr:uncharacterized protein I206_05657 [Kwoniella pini CBS 10737]OCF48876.1 hypothetical protein I206_05657 [Kwoniella pini CBS 10737]
MEQQGKDTPDLARLKTNIYYQITIHSFSMSHSHNISSRLNARNESHVEKEDVVSHPDDTPADPGFPEGGYLAWSTVVGSWSLVFATFGVANTFGVFQSHYILQKYPERDSSDIAWIGSLQLFLQFMMGGVSGPLFDKGYFYPVVIGGAAIHILSFFMISLCNEFWQTFLAQGVLAGIGMGLVFVPALGVISQYFKRKRGLASGIVVTGSSAGGVVFPIMLNKLIVKVNFERGVQYTGVLIAGALVIGVSLIRPFGGVRGHKQGGPKPNAKSFFREPGYVLACIGVFFVAWGIFFPIVFLQYFAELTGASENLTFYMVAILNGASVVGRTLPNLVADKFGALNLITIMCLLSSAMCFAFFGASRSTAGLVVVAILYGAASGAFVSLLAPSIFSMAKSQAEIGTRMGITMLFLGIAALTGNPLGAAILDSNGYGASIAWSGSMVATGAALFGFAAWFTAKSKGQWKV